MSNGDLETRVSSLEERVSSLEETMNTLIANLGANNSMYLDALDVLAQTTNTDEIRTAAVSNARGSICTSNPPGCHV